jgi:hypothetical protein
MDRYLGKVRDKIRLREVGEGGIYNGGEWIY